MEAFGFIAIMMYFYNPEISIPTSKSVSSSLSMNIGTLFLFSIRKYFIRISRLKFANF